MRWLALGALFLWLCACGLRRGPEGPAPWRMVRERINVTGV
jgi:hypothetical protein